MKIRTDDALFGVEVDFAVDMNDGDAAFSGYRSETVGYRSHVRSTWKPTAWMEDVEWEVEEQMKPPMMWYTSYTETVADGSSTATTVFSSRPVER